VTEAAEYPGEVKMKSIRLRVDEGHVIGEDGLVYVKQGGSLQSANLTSAEEEESSHDRHSRRSKSW